MRNIVITEEAYQEITERLTSIEVFLKAKQSDVENVFLDNQEFLQLMYISKRTAQSWRDQGVIAYSQIGGKIYYRMSDILEMLDKHKVPAAINSNNLKND
ncbi:MAG: helix-turn-helix domain-containing protein [Crocinitomicaceae bacterium]|nr:helix-turn-helix domain-containing protein [Crocinitomicaceae bacterium]